MFDPASWGLLIWAVERIASLTMRSMARSELKKASERQDAEHSRLVAAKGAYDRQVHSTGLVITRLEARRLESARRILNQVVLAAPNLSRKREPVEGKDRLFGGPTFAEVRRFIEIAKTLSTRMPPSDKISAVSGTALLLAQGVSMLENAFPNLDDFDLHDLVASIPIDGAADVADTLGVLGDIGAGEALGFVGVALSGYALHKAHEQAGEIRRKAREISENADRMERETDRLHSVERRAEGTRQQLNTADYRLFKLSWATDQLTKRYPRERGLPPQHRKIIDAFASHAKAYWQLIITPPIETRAAA